MGTNDTRNIAHMQFLLMKKFYVFLMTINRSISKYYPNPHKNHKVTFEKLK